MKPENLHQLSVDELVERFAEIGTAQNEVYEEPKKYNRLFRQMEMIDKELRARGPEARLVLLRLHNHPNVQVRTEAATRTLALAPERSRKIIEQISQSPWLPQALDARLTIRWLDDGTYKPD